MSWFDYVLQRVWKTAPKAKSTDELYIASMKSMIQMQQDIIVELGKTNEHYRALLEAKDTKLEDISDIVPPISDEPPRVFKPLREGVELPSQRRARLTQKYRDLAAAEQSKKGKEESNGKEV